MLPKQGSAYLSSVQSSSPAAVDITKSVRGEIEEKPGTGFLHAAGILIQFVLDVTVATASVGVWNDILKLCVTRVKQAVRFPNSDKEYYAFDVGGKGFWLLQKLQDEILYNDPATSTGSNIAVRVTAWLPFSMKLRDNFFPTLIPVGQIGDTTIQFAPARAHANVTMNAVTIKAFCPVVELPSRQNDYAVTAWKEQLMNETYCAKHDGTEVLQAMYLCNTKDTNANRVISLNSDELGLIGVDGRDWLDQWVRRHPFRDLLDDANLVTVAGDSAFPLMESDFNSRDSGIRGKLKWYWDSNGGPSANTILKRYIPEIRG